MNNPGKTFVARDIAEGLMATAQEPVSLEEAASQAAKELGAVLAIGGALAPADLPIIRRRLDEVVQAVNAAMDACQKQNEEPFTYGGRWATSPVFVVELLEKAIGSSLDTDQRYAVCAVLEGLPVGSGLGGVVEAMKTKDAAGLCVSEDQYIALVPLISSVKTWQPLV